MRPGRDRSCRVALPLLLAGLLAGCCSEAPPKSESPDSAPVQSFVELAVDTGPGSTPGPIQGRVRCGDEDLPPAPPCLAGDLTLAEAVLACGPVEATVDRGTSHRLLVRFPAGLGARFPAMPSDLEIVRCVQARVGFSFAAGIAAGPDAIADSNPTPFAALHSRPGETRPR